MSALKVLLNIALWLSVTNAKTSQAERYSNVLSSLFKKSSSYDPPIMTLDRDSNYHDKTDHDMTYSQKGHRNDLDESTENSANNDDVPYAFLYLYKLLQQVKDKYNHQNRNSKYLSHSSMGNRKPNREHRSDRWRSDRRDKYRHRQRSNRNNKYEDNDDRYGYEDNSHSRQNYRHRLYEGNHRHGYKNSYRYHHDVRHRNDRTNRAQSYSSLNSMNYNNHYRGNRHHSLNERHYYRYGNRNHNNVDRYENRNNRYHNTHNRYKNGYNNDRYDGNRDLDRNRENNRYRYMESDEMTNRLTEEDREIIKLQQNIVQSPLVESLLGISNIFRQRELKDSCESDDSCEEATEANIDETSDDPCEENSNSCGEDEDKNPSTRGIVNDYVSDPPPKMCEPGKTC